MKKRHIPLIQTQFDVCRDLIKSTVMQLERIEQLITMSLPVSDELKQFQELINLASENLQESEQSLKLINLRPFVGQLDRK